MYFQTPLLRRPQAIALPALPIKPALSPSASHTRTTAVPASCPSSRHTSLTPTADERHRRSDEVAARVDVQ